MLNPSSYVGVDADIERIDCARRLLPDCISLIMKNQKITFPNEFFDVIIIIATLHHIPDKLCSVYFEEFSRILKLEGKIVVIEPCLFSNSYFDNWFMNFLNKGKYIRSAKIYCKLFENEFEVRIRKKFKKSLFYDEIFLTGKKGMPLFCPSP